jgi:hypothetical protein
MRGEDQRSDGFFSYLRLETRIPADHPLRPIRDVVDPALLELSPSFDKLYRAKDVRRSHRSGCCGRFCCRPSTRSVRNGS